MSKSIMIDDKTYELAKATGNKFGYSNAGMFRRAIEFFVEISQMERNIFTHIPGFENLYEKAFGSEKIAYLKLLKEINDLKKEISEIKNKLNHTVQRERDYQGE